MQAQIQALNSTHHRTSFDCGVAELNDWFCRMAGQQQEKHIAKTFVVIDLASPDTPLGFYALTASQIDGREMPDKKRPNLVPVILVGRFAVAASYQGQGLGKILLMNALERVAKISDEVGIMAVIVHAKETQAANFYRKYGFTACQTTPLQLFLPTATLRRLFD